MRNQSLMLYLLLAILLRHVVPFVDVFLVVLACFILARREQMVTTSYIAVGVAVIYSLLLESPIGLLPLVLSITLFLFISFFKKALDLGIPPLFIAFIFIASTIALESLAHLVLVTGRVQLLPQTTMTIFWSGIAMTVATFVISFKQKI